MQQSTKNALTYGFNFIMFIPQVIKEMLISNELDPHLNTFLGCCYFYLGMYDEAEKAALKGILLLRVSFGDISRIANAEL